MNQDYIQTSDGEKYADYAQSENGIYKLAWIDDDGKGNGGSRTSGKGTYWLFENGKEILKGKLPRPNDGAVSNTGIFCLADYLFGNQLGSKLFVINKYGDVLIEKKFPVNIGVTSISSNGIYAAVYTYNGESKKWANALIPFNVILGKEAWIQYPPLCVDQITIDEEKEEITASVCNNPEYTRYRSCTLTLRPSENAT